MAELIKLPNGRWIDPADVRGVEPLDAVQWGDQDALPRVRIDIRESPPALIECADHMGAVAFADQIAEASNVARRAAREKIDD